MYFSSKVFFTSYWFAKVIIFSSKFCWSSTDSMQILGSSYDFTVVDSNSLSFLFKHAWNASEDLKIGPGSFEPTRDKWLVSKFFSGNINHVSF